MAYINFIFPGFDDLYHRDGKGNDKRDCLGLILKNMGDITIFVTDANRAFIDKSELEYFEKISKKSVEMNESGIFNEIIVVANKFDFKDDHDLQDIFKKIKSEKKFRWCSYAAFKNLNIPERHKAQGVTNVCDVDDLMKYLKTMDLDKMRAIPAFKVLCKGILTTTVSMEILIDNYLKEFSSKKKLIMKYSYYGQCNFSEIVMLGYFKRSDTYFPAEWFVWGYISDYVKPNKLTKALWKDLCYENSYEATWIYEPSRITQIKDICNKKITSSFINLLNLFDFDCREYFSIITLSLKSLVDAKNIHVRELAAWVGKPYYELLEAYRVWSGQGKFTAFNVHFS